MMGFCHATLESAKRFTGTLLDRVRASGSAGLKYYMNPRNGNTILAVNDRKDQLELMCAFFASSGYRCFTASNGREGFEVARAERPDLVISDVMMPVASGIELCRWMRADAELRSVPVLLVSALRKDTAGVVEGLAAGADDYLEAPYEPSRLIAQAARLIERKLADDALRESEHKYRLLRVR